MIAPGDAHAVAPRLKPVPKSGHERDAFAAKMGPIAWMLWNDLAHLELLFGTAIVLMRLDGLQEWADAVEQGAITECGECKRPCVVAGYSEEGGMLCRRCSR